MRSLCKAVSRAFSWREIASSHRLMAAMILALGVLSYCFGERVPEAGGLGWDGVTYASITRDLSSSGSPGQLSAYYAHRLLPSVVVRGMMLLAGASFSNINIIRGFECYNLIILLGASWVWKRLADNLVIGLGGRWLGFCGIFLSFMGSKHTFYYPVLTDPTAVFVGLLALLCYVEKRPVALLATSLVGAFAWHIAGICGALLLLFPRTELLSGVVTPAQVIGSVKSAQLVRYIKLAWIVLLVLSMIGVACCLRVGSAWDLSKLGPVIATQSTVPLVVSPLDRISRTLTGLPSVAGVVIALAMLAGSVAFFRSVIWNLRLTRLSTVVYAFAALLVPGYIVKVISDPALAGPGGDYRACLLEPPNGEFLLPLVAQAVWWGPVVILLVLNWRAFSTAARKLGAGFIAVVGLHLPLGLSSEPRFVTFGWPFLVLGAVLAMEVRHTKPSFKYAFALLTVLYGQSWLKLNLAPWSNEIYGNMLEFPKQLYFMHYGLWMGWWTYLLQLGALVLGTLWLRSTMLPPRLITTHTNDDSF